MKQLPGEPPVLPDPKDFDDGMDILFEIIKKRMLALHEWNKKYESEWGEPFDFSRSIDTVTVFDGTSAYVINGSFYLGKMVMSMAEFPRKVFVEKGSAKRGMQFLKPVTGEHLVFDTVTRDTVSHVVRYHIMRNESGRIFLTNPWEDDTYGAEEKITVIHDVKEMVDSIKSKKYGPGFAVIEERPDDPAVVAIMPGDALASAGVTREQAMQNALEKLVDDCLVQACKHAPEAIITEDSLLLIIDEIDDIYADIVNVVKERKERKDEYKKMREDTESFVGFIKNSGDSTEKKE